MVFYTGQMWAQIDIWKDKYDLSELSKLKFYARMAIVQRQGSKNIKYEAIKSTRSIIMSTLRAAHKKYAFL